MKNSKLFFVQVTVLICGLVIGLQANADAQNEISLEGVEKLVLQVRNTQFKLNGNSDVRRALLNESMYSIDKKGSLAVIRQNEFNQVDEGAVKAPVGIIELSGKILVEIHGRDLRIDTQNWQSDVAVHGNSLKLYLNGGTGFVQSSALKVDFVANEFKGRVKGDFQGGKIALKGGSLDGEIALLNGELLCEKTTGALSVSSFAAQIKTVKCGGNWSIDNLKGGTVAQNWSGRLEGISQEGPFAVSLADEGDVNIKTQSGRVTLTPPATASVALNLQSTEGDIVTPSYLKVSKEGQKKFLKGRSQGQGEKGSFYVRTQEGVIFVK